MDYLVIKMMAHLLKIPKRKKKEDALKKERNLNQNALKKERYLKKKTQINKKRFHLKKLKMLQLWMMMMIKIV
jgi:hypothetical protein